MTKITKIKTEYNGFNVNIKTTQGGILTIINALTSYVKTFQSPVGFDVLTEWNNAVTKSNEAELIRNVNLLKPPPSIP